MTRIGGDGGGSDRDRAAIRVVYGLFFLIAFVVVVGVVGNLVDRAIHIEVAAVGALLGAITTILIGKAIIGGRSS